MAELNMRSGIDAICQLIRLPLFNKLKEEFHKHPDTQPSPERVRSACTVDGHMKVHRSACPYPGVVRFVTDFGRVVYGCGRTPVRGKIFCPEHLDSTSPEGPSTPGAESVCYVCGLGSCDLTCSRCRGSAHITCMETEQARPMIW